MLIEIHAAPDNLGVPAFASVVRVFWLMVTKPA